MSYGLIAGAAACLCGNVCMHIAYDKTREEKEKYFLGAVVLNLLIQAFLIYEYICLRGGFVVHGCIYAVTGALLIGALVLWTSRMLFSFSHEGFRVLLGVSAIVAGCFGGCGIDMLIAFNSGMSNLSSYSAALALCTGAISIMLSDIIVMIGNFSIKDLKIYHIIFDITSAIGVVVIFYGAVIA